MSVKTLGEVAENYFHSLNPIAERISTDIESIRDAYEGLWNCLSNREKEQIINETIIYPEAILKYTLNSQSYEFPSLNTREITGAKFIVDEHSGLSWRDEHSAPFSWKTPSQIDLRLFGLPKIESPTKPDNTTILNNQIKTIFHETPNKLSNGTSNDSDLWARKVISEKNGIKKPVDTPDSPNIVLGGTCSKISGLCSKLKFLPGKSCSYEVKTITSYPPENSSSNILDKIKGSAVLKIQNTIKLVGGKTYVANEKKSMNDCNETENLVQAKNVIQVTKLQKPSPKVAKPKSPPPPPPILKQKIEETDGNETGKGNMIIVKNNKTEKSNNSNDDLEKMALLEDNSLSSFPSTDHDSYDKYSKVVHELSDELNSLSTNFTQLSGHSSDNIPKSGFDFLDNW